MDIRAVKVPLAAILQHLAADYSQQTARKLMPAM
jgi:hypothetical protein